MKASRPARIAGTLSCFVLAAALALLIPQAGGAAEDEGSRSFILPAGDAAAGEEVFLRLECISCHTVPGKTYDRSRWGDPIGPELNAIQAAQTRESIAGRLISYDRFLSEGLYKATYSRSDGSSRMGNFNDAMTVRDLIDLVEFIKSLE